MKQLIVFGASGDLAKRKLMPALSNIESRVFTVIAYARSPLEETYPAELREFHDYDTDFPDRVRYVQGEYDNLEKLDGLIGKDAVCYFSLPPNLYRDLLEKTAPLGFSAVGLEKPFGTSQESFLELANAGTDNVYFIDHYLLKPLMVALPEIFRNDSRLCALLNSKNVSFVEAYFCEELGVEGRAYYDKTGCVADVLQNHLAVCLATVLAGLRDPRPGSSSQARADIIRRMSLDGPRCLYGQYEGYESEMEKSSSIETFALLPLFVNNESWEGVPFVLLGGKSLKEKRTEIIFNIRACRAQSFIDILAAEDRDGISPEDIEVAQLCFNIAPDSEVYLALRGRTGTHKYVIYPLEMLEEIMSSLGGPYREYELIFKRFIQGDMVFCCKTEEVRALWELFDPILKVKAITFCYPPGVHLPREAEELLDEIKSTL